VIDGRCSLFVAQCRYDPIFDGLGGGNVSLGGSMSMVTGRVPAAPAPQDAGMQHLRGLQQQWARPAAVGGGGGDDDDDDDDDGFVPAV
jgi:hypothetical protein